MSKFTKEELDLVFWHASLKMRQGFFGDGYQLFSHLYEELPSFHVALGMAYCAYRNQQLELARNALALATPTDAREERLLARLQKRVGL